jgi:hypothetical protein
MGLILFTLNLKGSDEFKGKEGNECESEFTWIWLMNWE